MSSIVQVAVGVIVKNGRILIAKRPDHLHQGGKWEFPGGKVDAGETVQQALVRELLEELNLRAQEFEPLIQIQHQYPEKTVLLDVYKITQFEGEPRGNEGQEIRWVLPAELSQFEFPPANKPIVTAANLPSAYAITGEYSSAEELFSRLNRLLTSGIKLIQWRAKTLPKEHYLNMAANIAELTHAVGARLQLNCPLDWFAEKEWPSHVGLHLSSAQLMALPAECVAKELLGCGSWLSASCHSEAELEKAQQVGVDFVVLSPVLKTSSHPNVLPLGWEAFSQMVRQTKLPVYALGGMGPGDLEVAQQQGAQGIAGINCFWH